MNRKPLTGLFSGAFRLLLGIMLTLGTKPMLVAQAAVLTVNSTTDAIDVNPGDGICATAGGLCTLRAAIQEANALAGNDTILLPSGTYTLTIVGADENAAFTGDLDITSNLVISATGATRPIVDGNGNVLTDRVFHILNSSTASILGVNIQGGKTGSIVMGPYVDGGGILNSSGSVLTLTDSILSDNVGMMGGGIRNSGTMTVRNVILSNNIAEVQGGGINNGGTMIVDNSTINGNTPSSIENTGSLTATNGVITGSINGIINNGALTLNNTRVGNNTGGGIVNMSGSLTLNNSTVSTNNVGLGNNGSAILNNTLVSDNNGAGILNGLLANLSLSSSIIRNNQRPMGGGGGIDNDRGTVTLTGTIVTGNSALAGGGISNYSGSLTVINSAVTGNSTNGDGSGGAGGGIYTDAGTLILINSTVSGNTASGIGGGGGIYSSGILTLTNSTVSGNTVLAAFGGQCFASSCSGGGLYSSGDTRLNNATISANLVLVSAGTTCSVLGCKGGGLYNASGTVLLNNTILASNTVSPTLADSGPDCYGIVSSSGYNLLGNTSSCVFTTNVGDLLNTNPLLFPLIGSPGYHPLLLHSPAIDFGDPSGCKDYIGNLLTTDQRGMLRPVDGNSDGSPRCDIGAYEFDPSNNPISQTFLPIASR